jgi:protein-tyrosine kinase
MTRIEEALKKLQASQGRPPARTQETLAPSPRSLGEEKRARAEGQAHHISQQALIRAGLLPRLDQAAQVAEEFRRIKRPLIVNAEQAAAGGPANNLIMIASGMPGSGKTFCAVNLAYSIAFERELNVLLVDADVSKPQISREFGLADAPGLIDLLVDEKRDLGDVLVRTDLEGIVLLPAGAKHPRATELLASDRMGRIATELANRYADRILVLDSPPLLVTSEAQVLATHVGQIVLVVEAGKTTEQVLAQTLETLDPDKTVNLILNKTAEWVAGQRYGYYGKESA